MLVLDKKIFVGRKLRSLRDLLGMTQSKMAAALDISPTYLNLLEHNNRHLTLNVLLKLGERFDVDMKAFAIDESPELHKRLTKVFEDPMISSNPISQKDIHDLSKDFPSASEAVISLYESYNRLHEQHINAKTIGVSLNKTDPFDILAKTFENQRKALDKLETSANEFREELYALNDLLPSSKKTVSLGNSINIFPLISHYVEVNLGLRVRIIPANVMGSALRRYDPHRREILLNKKLKKNALQFHLVVQTALIVRRDLFEKITRPLGDGEVTNQSMLRTALAGYFAGVVTAPERPFIFADNAEDASPSIKNSINSFYFAAAFAALGNEMF